MALNSLVRRRPVLAVLFAMMVVPTLAGASPADRHGLKPIAVDSLADPGTPGDKECTLREAIANANLDGRATRKDCAKGGGTDAIAFAVSGTITIDPAAGPLAITDPDGLVVDGGGAVTLSGGDAVGLLSMSSGSALTVRGLKLTHGSAAFGAGIMNDNGTLTIADTTFARNVAELAGGGVLNFGGAVAIVDSTFIGNHAVSGGGIDSEGGTVTLITSRFSGNTATGGGGIEMFQGLLAVSGSRFTGNHATSGGAIDNNFGSLTVARSTFARNSGTSGAGISSSGSSTVTRSHFSGNQAGFGAGISNDQGVLTVAKSSFSENEADSAAASSPPTRLPESPAALSQATLRAIPEAAWSAPARSP